MSDFFSGIYRGIREPDVAMNKGPLPPENTSSGFPKGFDGTPDGRINQHGGSLLGSVSPYAYGEADRLSTQTAYLNIPHAAYRIVPPIQLPGPLGTPQEGADTFVLNHQLDDGDICFVIRALYTPHEIIQNKGKYARQGILHAIDPVCNLSTVNYVLHGLQRYGFDSANIHWHTLWVALGLDHHFHGGDAAAGTGHTGAKPGQSLAQSMKEASDTIKRVGETPQNAALRTDEMEMQRMSAIVYLREARRMVAQHLIKEVIRPFGVPRGSEKQGGQHQGLVNSTVTWPVDLVTSVLIDGKVINLVNVWRQSDINSGDDLILYLDERGSNRYTLSHHPKSLRKQIFPRLGRWEIPKILATDHNDSSMQRESKQRIWDILATVHARLRNDDPDSNDDILDPNRARPDVQGYYDDTVRTDNERGLESVMAIHAARNLNWVLTRATTLGDLGILLANLPAPPANQANHNNRLVANIGMAIVKALSIDREPERPESNALAFVDESIWQLVPGVTSSNVPGVHRAVWRHGYWHIARAQLMQFAYDGHLEIHSGEDAAVSGKPLEATFEPVWQEPLEADIISGTTTYASAFASGEDDASTRRKRERDGTARPAYAIRPYEELIQGAEVLADRIRRATEQGRVLRAMGQAWNANAANAPGYIDQAGGAFMGAQLTLNPQYRLASKQKQPRHTIFLNMSALVHADELLQIGRSIRQLTDGIQARNAQMFELKSNQDSHTLSIRLQRAVGRLVQEMDAWRATIPAGGARYIQQLDANVQTEVHRERDRLSVVVRTTAARQPRQVLNEILGFAQTQAATVLPLLQPGGVGVYIAAPAPAPAVVAAPAAPVPAPAAAPPPAPAPAPAPPLPPAPAPPAAPPAAEPHGNPALPANLNPPPALHDFGPATASQVPTATTATDPSSMFRSISEAISSSSKKKQAGPKTAARASFLAEEEDEDEPPATGAGSSKKKSKRVPGGDL